MRDRLRSGECARALKALADPERLKIVQCLAERARRVGDLAETLGQPVANVSHHLAVLRRAGVVRNDRQGKYVLYSLHPDVFLPPEPGGSPACLDLGCCRLELTGR